MKRKHARPNRLRGLLSAIIVTVLLLTGSAASAEDEVKTTSATVCEAEETAVPKETAAPVETVTPQETAAPVETVTPQETAAPVETVMPQETAAPVETVTPQETVAPVETPAPQETAAPVETATPQETVASVETVTPVETATPNETAVPVETIEPTGSPAPAETAEPEETEAATTWRIGRKGIVRKKSTPMRATASSDAKKVKPLAKGSIVTVVSGRTDADGNTWYLVKYGNGKGYVLSGAIVLATDEDDGSGLIMTNARRKQKLSLKGNVDVSDGGMAIPTIYQFDYKTILCYYGGIPRSVSRSGCGVTCVSMVVAYLTGDTNQTPEIIFDWALENHMYYGAGLGHDQMRKVAAHWGVRGKWISNDKNAILSALKQGYPVIAHMGEGTFTDEGHYIVLRGITKDGQILVNDPNSKTSSNKVYPIETILDDARRSDSSFMMCYPIEGMQEN